MSLAFSIRIMYIQETGIDPETKKPPEGKMLDLLRRMEIAKRHKRS